MPKGVKTDERVERLARIMLETGKSRKQVSRTLGLGCGVVNRIAGKMQCRDVEHKSRMPEELLRQWDYVHERYGKRR